MKKLLIGLLAMTAVSASASESVCTQALLNEKGQTVVYSQIKLDFKKCIEWANQQLKLNGPNSSYAALIVQHPDLNGAQIKMSIEEKRDLSADANH